MARSEAAGSSWRRWADRSLFMPQSVVVRPECGYPGWPRARPWADPGLTPASPAARQVVSVAVTTFDAVRGPVVRGLALAALIVGLVVMHHMAGATQGIGAPHRAEHGTVAPHGQPHGGHSGAVVDTRPSEPDPSHDATTHILHLCLAVLTATILLIAALAVRRTRQAQTADRAHTIRRLTWSPPLRPFGTALLTRLCVLRT